MATLTVTGRSDVAGVAADIDDVGRAARDAATDVATVDDAARQSGAGLDALGAAGDDVASKSSQATGALGALSGGLEAIGATGAASALQATAIATDVASGAGDALNLIAETTVGKYVAQTAASVAHRVATIAGAAATGAMTVAQTALNVVMSANPLLLVVIALAALTAGVILAYKNSETFRDIIDGAFGIAKRVIDTAADAVENIVGWFADLPGTVRDAAGTVKDKIEEMFAPVETAIEWVGDLFDDLEGGARGIASTVAGFFSDMFAPIETAIGWVQDLIDKIGDIDFPDLNPLNRSSRGVEDGEITRAVGGVFAPLPTNVKFELTAAAQDQDKAMQTLTESLREYFARQGMTLSITEVPA